MTGATPDDDVRSQQRVFGGAHRDEGERDLSALQAPRGLGVDVAFVQIDLGAQGLQGLQVQVDGTRADGAAARQLALRS